MTEQEWLAATDPQPMLKFLHGKVSDRKVRLFAVTCFRRVPELCGDEWTWTVQVAEQNADGQAQVEDVHRLHQMPWDGPPASRAAGLLVGRNCLAAAMTAVWYASDRRRPRYPEKYGRPEALPGLAVLFRDIFGNPFRSVAVDVTWLTSTVIALAGQMYDSRDFSAMPILADALQDAGCDNDDILNHCREPGQHVRGCWIIDLLMARK